MKEPASIPYNEREIRRKLKKLLRFSVMPPSLPIKSGGYKKNPILIYNFKRLADDRAFHISPEKAAYFLTANPPKLIEKIKGIVDSVLILPEFISNDTFVLTHIYLPENKALAVFLYPDRLNRKIKTSFHSRFFPGQRRPAFNSGLFTLVLEQIANLAGKGDSEDLHKFVIPANMITNNEANILKELNEVYSYSLLPFY